MTIDPDVIRERAEGFLHRGRISHAGAYPDLVCSSDDLARDVLALVAHVRELEALNEEWANDSDAAAAKIARKIQKERDTLVGRIQELTDELAKQEETNDHVVRDLKLFAAKANADADEDQARAVKAEAELANLVPLAQATEAHVNKRIAALEATEARLVEANVENQRAADRMVRKAEAERDTLREALAFYADFATYQESNEPHPTQFATGIVPVDADQGQIARAALTRGAGDE